MKEAEFPYRKVSKQFKLVGLLVSVICLFFSQSYSQITYVSANNQNGNWNAVSTWTRLPASETWAPATPGNPTNSNADAINIFGYVRVESGGLTVNNANPVITVNDTLYIVGNVTLGSGASMNVPAGGILVITGNLTLEGSFNMANGGNVVVQGNLNVTNGNVNNTANFYVFGATTASGGGKVNGCDGFGNPGGCNPRTAGGIGNSTDLANNNPSLSDFVDNLGVLPVELLHFYVENSNDELTLHWATASELNFDRFIIEKTSDGKNFEEIGSVQGAGVSTSRIEYSFIDEKVFLGRTYYRLKAIDFDGYTEYFGVVTALVEGNEQIRVVPNPSSGTDVKIHVNFSSEEPLYYKVIDASGMEVFSSRIEPNSFETEFTMDNVFSAGLYFLVVSKGLEKKVVRFAVY